MKTDFIIENKVIEQPIIIDKVIDLDYYVSLDEVIKDLDILRIIAHSNSQNRGGNDGFPVCKSKKSMCHRLISSITNVCYMGRWAPANLVLVGVKLGEYLKEYGMFDSIVSGTETIAGYTQASIIISDKLDTHEAFCCYITMTEENKEHMGNVFKNNKDKRMYGPYFQFSGFTATLQEILV